MGWSENAASAELPQKGPARANDFRGVGATPSGRSVRGPFRPLFHPGRGPARVYEFRGVGWASGTCRICSAILQPIGEPLDRLPNVAHQAVQLSRSLGLERFASGSDPFQSAEFRAERHEDVRLSVHAAEATPSVAVSIRPIFK
jgi:hypothetical protein